MPDAPAVYFIRPTTANLARVAEDCSKQLYRSIHLHFSSRIERHDLEYFAQTLLSSSSSSSAAQLVTKIYDEYLDVIALEPNLFTLNVPSSFKAYNDPSISEASIRAYMNRIAMGIFSLVRVMVSSFNASKAECKFFELFL